MPPRRTVSGNVNRQKNMKLKIVGISNGVAKLERIGGGFGAMADCVEGWIVGDIVDVHEKDLTTQGELSAYRVMEERYDA